MDSLRYRINSYVDMEQGMLAKIANLPHRMETYRPGDDIVKVREIVDYFFIIESGWAMRSLMLDDSRRQILNFMLPGDCFDLMSLTEAIADHNIIAATDVKLRRIDSREFLRTLTAHPKLATAFRWMAIQEEAILREQIVRIGRRTAKERVGHLILELDCRLARLGVVRDGYVKLPIPQAMLADALGLSIVHVSRTMSQLRTDGLIATDRAGIQIKNRSDLEAMSGFDQTYLHPEKFRLSA